MARPPRDDSPWATSDLGALESLIWSNLQRGAQRPREAFHWPTVATTGDEGPTARTVVLREVDGQARRLTLHTDLRSAKVRHLRADARLAWLFYDGAKKLQIRANAIATLHHGEGDEVAVRTWSELSVSSRMTYCASPAPATESAGWSNGLPGEWSSERPQRHETEEGFEHSCVVRTRVTELEVLYLSRAGHRRARMRFDEDPGAQAKRAWLIP